MNEVPAHYYFAYGSNVDGSFLEERLKDGEWTSDGWHKTGQLRGKKPTDYGVYYLDGYEFGYTLQDGKLTTGNIAPKEGSRVYGVLYGLSEEQFQELDRTEDVPRDYKRVAVVVHRLGLASLDKMSMLTADVYVGNPERVTDHVCPVLEYVDRLIDAATKRCFPPEYIDSYLKVSQEAVAI